MHRFIFSFFLLCLFLNGNSQGSKMSLKLQAAMIEEPTHPVTFGILLRDRLNIQQLDKELYQRKADPKKRAFEVITSLQSYAAQTQPAIIQFLQADPGVSAGSIESFWVTNVIFVTATPEAAHRIEALDAVEWMEISGEAQPDEIKVEKMDATSVASVNGREQGLTAIGAPGMWAMGFSGHGRLAMGIDTGVEPNHPAVASKWRGNFAPLSESWFTYNNPGASPVDCGSNNHGTHTMGTMIGLASATNDTIGVAFNAQWIASPGICSGMGTSARIAAFQWAMDPDNNPGTITDMPDVINNSWYDPTVTGECTSIYESTLISVEAAGIAVCFSAGNEGPGVSTITPPKNINTSLVNTFTIGNVNGNNVSYPIESSSSRGPSICGGTGSLLIKPEVVAPGANVRSCIGTNSYALYTGTSMASPHAAGAILLLKEAFPALTGTQLKEAIYYSAIDLGPVGEDDAYGMGMINLPAAYNWLVTQGNTPIAYTWDAQPLSVANLSSATCSTSVDPSITLRNTGDSIITSLSIGYQYSGLPVQSFAWNGSLAPLSSTSISLPNQVLTLGYKTLTVWSSSPNGNTDNRPWNDTLRFSFSVAEKAIATGDTSFCPAPLSLHANAPSSGTIKWFPSSLSWFELASGQNFTTPFISSTATYQADIVHGTNLGKTDNSGSGTYSVSQTPYLIFDVSQSFVIRSVLVYANGPSTCTIELRNNAGGVINSITANLPSGGSRVDLDFGLYPGTDFRLGISGGSGLYYNTTGATFPYTVPGVVSITGSSTSGSYYFFYDWEVEYGSACGRAAAIASIQHPITAGLNAVPNSLNLNVSNSVQFTAYPTNAQSYQWDFGDGGTSTLQNPSHVFSFGGTFTITLIVTDTSACFDTLQHTYSVIGGVGISDDIQNSTLIQFYPNPVKDFLTLEIGENTSGNISVEIWNTVGQMIQQIDLRVSPNENAELDFRNLANGMYFIRTDVNSNSSGFRILKEN